MRDERLYVLDPSHGNENGIKDTERGKELKRERIPL